MELRNFLTCLHLLANKRLIFPYHVFRWLFSARYQKLLALFQFPPFKFNFEKSIYRCHNAIKLGVVNKFVLHTLQRNITHLALITRKTNIRLGILKGGNWKRAKLLARKDVQSFLSTLEVGCF